MNQKIIYGVPNSNTPSGGVKVIYKHSEILNELGISSGVWHPGDDAFKCNWFDNKVKLIKTSEMDPINDFIILPEIWASTHVALFKNMGFKVGIYVQNCFFITRSCEAGYLANLLSGRTGRVKSSPPQLGQIPFRCISAHDLQNVHSNEQMSASLDCGGRSLSQHSQFGRISSMSVLERVMSDGPILRSSKSFLCLNFHK